MKNHPYRPGGLDIRSQSFDPPRSTDTAAMASASMSSLSLADLPSPRAGEVPPALSPLDALALQGRLLAKRFEQADKTGRRLSRLAPLTIQNEFGNRGGYFSNLSSGVNSPDEEVGPINSQSVEAAPPQHVSEKHRSFYPQFGGDEPEYEPKMPARSPMAPIEENSPVASPLARRYRASHRRSARSYPRHTQLACTHVPIVPEPTAQALDRVAAPIAAARQPPASALVQFAALPALARAVSQHPLCPWRWQL
jgi:hypothetical protein